MAVTQPEKKILLSSEEEQEGLAQTVVQAYGGNSEAFDILFHRFNARIFRYLARMTGNDDEGRDLTQETFLKAWRMLPSIQDASRFSPWLYRIATNVAIDHLQRSKRRWPRQRNDAPEDQTAQLQEGPEDQVAQTLQIRQVLALISPKYRACLLLQIEGGFSQREIAAMLCMSEKNVSVYVRRGSEQFRCAYERLEQGQAPIVRRNKT
jgi:RNA polymerase sigma-70 factor, ECF subfamily